MYSNPVFFEDISQLSDHVGKIATPEHPLNFVYKERPLHVPYFQEKKHYVF